VCTIKRRLAEHGIHKHIKAERPRITPVLARRRYQWCLKHRHWTIEQWREVVWSDECSVEKSADPAVQWVFRTSKEKWLPECVKGVRKSGGVKQMVWACFAGGLKGTCNGLRVEEGGSVNARAYVRTLEFSLLDFLEELEEKGISPVFMQDNARVHTAKLTKEWMEENNVEVLEDWPPYSPDLNPIEHVWVQLKKLYHEHYSHLAADTRSADKVKPLIEEALIHCWELIPDTLFENLVQSIPRRIAAVIRAKGWYTKY
jgi:transposase